MLPADSPVLLPKKPRKRRSKERENVAEMDNCSTASSSCISLDSIPADTDSTSHSPNSIPAVPNSTSHSPNSNPDALLGIQCNGGMMGPVSSLQSSGLRDKVGDDGVRTVADLLHTDGGGLGGAERHEGAWRGSGELGENMSLDCFDGDIAAGQQEEGKEEQSREEMVEWDVDSTLTNHVIGHMTEQVVGWDILEQEVTGHVDVAGHQGMVEEQVKEGGGVAGGVRDCVLDQDCPEVCSDQEMGHNLLQDGQDICERRDTLIAENKAALPPPISLNPFIEPSPPGSAPISPINPFTPAVSPHQEVTLSNSAGVNPFLPNSPTNPFLQPPDPPTLEDHTPRVAVQPLNPFYSDSTHHSPSMLSTNPFDVDDHTHTLEEPCSLPSNPLTSHSPKTSEDFPDHYEVPVGPGLLPTDTLPLPSVPPPTAPLNQPLPANSSPLNLNFPPNTLAKSLQVERPGSASTSRSHTTEDRSSCSGSSIDLSSLVETTPSSPHLSSPAHLTSPDENFFEPEVCAF